MRRWIFQANPKHYNIAGALAALNEIQWRVPQYTGDVHAGDSMMLWESGKNAGIIAVGRVCSEPALAPVPEAELPFLRDGDGEASSATRVRIVLRPVERAMKANVAALPEMADHGIIRAPMGTVFPVEESEWAALRRLVKDELPDLGEDASPRSEFPPVFAWQDRTKDTYPIPGGYLGQMKSLALFSEHIAAQRPTFDEFVEWLHTDRTLSATNSRMLALFLRRSGMIKEIAGRLELGGPTIELIRTGKSDLVIAQLHSRSRFIGEFLAALRTPRTPDEMLQVANEQFGMTWTTKAQIQRRRGWLQSAGMLDVDESSWMHLTKAGEALTERLTLHEPLNTDSLVEPSDDVADPPMRVETSQTQSEDESTQVQELQQELRASSTRSKSPDGFEYAIRDAFRFLGFRAQKLGGSGKTDVVADADLGRDDAYRVIIDGKTTGDGRVTDGQIDWDTIDDHRKLHHANYVVIAGPGFGGDRTRSRARNHNVILMTAEDLVELVGQHEVWPLGLDAYRRVFDGQSGEVDLEGITEEAESSERLLTIASAVISQIDGHASETGPLSARDLFFLLRNQPDLDATEHELNEAAISLASPLVGVLAEKDGRYRMSSSIESAVRRSALLASRLGRAE